MAVWREDSTKRKLQAITSEAPKERKDTAHRITWEAQKREELVPKGRKKINARENSLKDSWRNQRAEVLRFAQDDRTFEFEHCAL
jgi:hypothetical protein